MISKINNETLEKIRISNEKINQDHKKGNICIFNIFNIDFSTNIDLIKSILLYIFISFLHVQSSCMFTRIKNCVILYVK